jgi:hypothetical protein
MLDGHGGERAGERDRPALRPGRADRLLGIGACRNLDHVAA